VKLILPALVLAVDICEVMAGLTIIRSLRSKAKDEQTNCAYTLSTASALRET
jgi:hypothetical protein